MKRYLFGSVVLGSSKDHIEGNFPNALRLSAWYYSCKGGVALLDARFIDVHLVLSVCVDEV